MEKMSNINSNMEKIRTPEEYIGELMGFQLEYVERLFQKENPIRKPEIETKDEYKNEFIKILAEFTSIRGYLQDEYCKRLSNPEDVKRDDFDYNRGLFIGEILLKIDGLYKEDKNTWKERTVELLDNKLNDLGPVVNDLDKLFNKKENRCGLINFDISKIDKSEDIEKLKNFNFNLDSFDDCMNIHFRNLFEQKRDDPSCNISSIERSFSLLSERIVDEYPQVKAIIGRSWLMDSVIAEKYKFTVFNRRENYVNDNNGFWGQFVDENGHIKKVEIKKFLDTGKAKYCLAEGFMFVKDFLKEYLPEERKKNGRVKLMDYTDEAKRFGEEINEILHKIEKDFKILSYEEIIEMVRSNNIMSDYLNTEEGQEFLKMFKRFKESGLRSMDELEYDGRERIRNNWNSFLNKHKSELAEKEVDIS